jgi:hypothetical protein
MSGHGGGELRRRELAGLVGLIAVTAWAALGAVQLAGVDRSWWSNGSAVNRSLQASSILAGLVFAVASAVAWSARRRADARDRVHRDERSEYIGRRSALIGFAAMFLGAVLVASFPVLALPGRVVALAIIALGTGGLLVGQVTAP